MTESMLVATAVSYVVSPTALAAVAPNPDRAPDQLSAQWMPALGARLVREVGDLITGATAAKQRLATFAIDTELRFATAADRAAVAQELKPDRRGCTVQRVRALRTPSSAGRSGADAGCCSPRTPS